MKTYHYKCDINYRKPYCCLYLDGCNCGIKVKPRKYIFFKEIPNHDWNDYLKALKVLIVSSQMLCQGSS